MVSLSILAMVLAISAAGFRPPSDEIKLNRKVSEFISRVSDARLKAIRSHRAVGIDVLDCGGELLAWSFYPDGTAIGPEICLAEGDRQETLVLSSLTGLVSRSSRDE
nr:hypothetical protein [Ruegeria arenilitoris]